MSLVKTFKTDLAKSNNGVKFEYPEAKNEDGSIPYFLLSRMSASNKKFAEEFERQTRPHRAAIENKRISNELANELALNTFCKTILLGWGNVQLVEGDDLEFNYENAKFLFANPEYADLYADLQTKASNVENYKPEDMERDAKN